MLVQQAYTTFSFEVQDENKWKEISDFWYQLSSYLEDDKNLVVKSVGELMRQEIEQMWHVQGLFSLVQMYPPSKLRPHEHKAMVVISRYNFHLDNFTSISYLFLELLPHHLPPTHFFRTADAFYLFICNYFYMIVENGSDFPSITKLAYSFVQIGTMCPKSKFEYAIPQRAEQAAIKSAGKRLNTAVLSKLNVVRERFSNYSQTLADKMHRAAEIPLFKGYHVHELYRKLLNDAIKQVKSVYIQMRRIVYYIFLRIYPVDELYSEIKTLLKNGLNIYFSVCIDMLKVCKGSLNDVETGQFNFEALTRTAFQDVYIPYRSECIALPGICKEAVVEHIRLFYKSIRDNLRTATAKDIIIYASKCASSGFNPTTNGEAWSYCSQGINTFMCMSSELESAVNECRDSSQLVVLIRKERDIAPLNLHNLFVWANENVPPLQGGRAGKTLSTLRLLPLNDELRKAITSETLRIVPPTNQVKRKNFLREMREVFNESHPEFTPSLAPHNPFFPNWNFDMKSYVPPQDDVLSKEELNELFKFYV